MHVGDIIKKTGQTARELKKSPDTHPGRRAKEHHPAHLGGQRTSLDSAGRISGKVGSQYYWLNHKVNLKPQTLNPKPLTLNPKP